MTKNKVVLTVLAILILLLTIDYLYYNDKVYPGVYLKELDINIGGKNQSELRNHLENLTVNFVGSEGSNYAIPIGKIGITLEKDKIIDKAYQVGRETIYPFNIFNRLRILYSGHQLNLEYQFNPKSLDKNLDYLTETMNKAPKNAEFNIKGEDIDIIPSEKGHKVNSDELRQVVTETIAQQELQLKAFLPYQLIEPDVTTQQLKEKGITEMMSSFCTEFDPNKEGRTHNIKLAADHLDMYEIAPGETFSFNDYIGDTTKEKGYEEAPIMMGDRLQPGVGGGICQVSSTLYSTFLEADIDILERHNHKMAVDYIDPGRDATISYGSYNLAVRNNYDHHLLISSDVSENTLCFHIFGGPMDKEIAIITETLETTPYPVEYLYDPNLDPGEEEVIQDGTKGYLTKVKKKVIDSGDQKRETVSLDRYLPMKEIIHYGE